MNMTSGAFRFFSVFSVLSVAIVFGLSALIGGFKHD